MRILMIADFYWPYVGGVEQHVRRLSQALAARGHSVAVVTLGKEDLAPFEQDGRVRVYRIRSTMQRAAWLFASYDRPWAPPFPDPEATGALMRILRQERPEIVHGHDWLARAFLPLKGTSRARFVMSLHYYTLTCAKKSLMRLGAPCSGPGFAKCIGCAAEHYGPAKGLAVAVSNWALSPIERKYVDIFLPVSQATAVANGLTPGPHCQIIPNFMPDEGDVAGDQTRFTAQLPLEPYLLFVGDLRRDKGIDVLLLAYAGLADAPPLILIGKVWSDTPAALPANVTVFKDWPNEAVLAAWKRCLVGIVPSIWPEPFGIVVIEAMASGCPVIASDIGGIPDILDHGAAGWLVRPGDPVALRQALERLLGDPQLRQSLGQAGQQRARAFQASVVVPQIERIYAELLRPSQEANEPAVVGEHHYQQL